MFLSLIYEVGRVLGLLVTPAVRIYLLEETSTEDGVPEVRLLIARCRGFAHPLGVTFKEPAKEYFPEKRLALWARSIAKHTKARVTVATFRRTKEYSWQPESGAYPLGF